MPEPDDILVQRARDAFRACSTLRQRELLAEFRLSLDEERRRQTLDRSQVQRRLEEMRSHRALSEIMPVSQSDLSRMIGPIRPPLLFSETPEAAGEPPPPINPLLFKDWLVGLLSKAPLTSVEIVEKSGCGVTYVLDHIHRLEQEGVVQLDRGKHALQTTALDILLKDEEG